MVVVVVVETAEVVIVVVVTHTYSAYYVPGALLSPLHILTHLILISKVNTIIIIIVINFKDLKTCLLSSASK